MKKHQNVNRIIALKECDRIPENANMKTHKNIKTNYWACRYASSDLALLYQENIFDLRY